MEIRTMIFLDTHVVIWLYGRKGFGLSQRVYQLIENASDLLVSPMVLLELEYLNEIGRITLPSPPVYEYLHRKINLRVSNLPFFDIIQSASKMTWTRDPFDRIIVGNADAEGAILITKDESILEHYAHAVW
jgi:PIN domain nuclease of toxin-antitoxin system